MCVLCFVVVLVVEHWLGLEVLGLLICERDRGGGYRLGKLGS